MLGNHLPSSDPTVRRDLTVLYDGKRKPNKGARVDDVASTITSDSLTILHKKIFIPNDVVTMVPKRSDRAGLSPPRYITVYEISLRARLCFPPPAKLIEISKKCEVSLSQILHRAMSVTVGLIVLFRDRGAILTPEYLSLMGRLTSDTQGRVTFRSKWLDIRTRDPAKSWSSAFFLVRNDWAYLRSGGR
ncbi:hypothetical protein IEQ34_021299 [Dendrobium chrysotoxum]|uniref:Uncharacterized protein n=1 Tax=Dendrobium chrysotoxum TaxID=161865 RepID=A0AAV7G4G3_DENCH|nr:hypothetical protein IEQ34_021299 [Dendrobium chrysotoxum]